jgi:hypothetical protein
VALRVQQLSAAAVAGAVVFLASTLAQADPGRTGLVLSFDLDTTWIRSMPSMSIGYTETPSHALAGGTIPATPSLMFLGAGLDLSLTYGHHWVFPLFGFEGGGAIGPRPSTISTLDGSVVQSRPWTTYRIEGLLPGVGYRKVDKRWLFSGTLRFGVVGYGVADGIATAGTTQHSEATSSVELAVRMDLKGCRRLDPTTRACLVVSPNLYEGGFLNGGSVALLWEIGR